MSFFKIDEVSNELLEAPNFVYGPNLDFVLLAEEVDEYKQLDVLPIDGWYWFDTVDEATHFFTKSD